MSKAPSAPIFVECYLASEPETVREVVDQWQAVTVTPGRWHCRASAPNGVRTVMRIEAPDGLISHETVATLMQQKTRIDDFWVEPSDVRAAPRDEMVLVGAWAQGRRLENEEWQIRSVGDGRHRRLMIKGEDRLHVDYVQVAIEGGASMVLRYPENGQLVLQTDAAPETPVRVMVVGTDAQVSGYWGFTRHAVVHGAYELGRKLAARLPEDAPGRDETIAAAHWLVVFGTKEPVSRHRIQDALASVAQTSDVRILRWLIAMRESGDELSPQALAEFVGLLATIRKDRPLFTEPLRLFIDYLTMAASKLREMSHNDFEQVRPSLEWVWSLASAMTWDTEHTGYRALSPATPDPKALTVHLDERAKKKSAPWRLPI